MTFRPFTIAVASGKGGTGKTSVATSLARVAASQGRSVVMVDGDVDAPNAAIFLGGQSKDDRIVFTLLPEVDFNSCTLCGERARVCRFKAITVLGPTVLVYPELCHACGGCVAVCPENAITETPQRIGEIRRRNGTGVAVVEGILDIGEVKAPRIIEEARKEAGQWRRGADLFIIDAPPGTSCSVVACITGADYLLLVTEPTPFGLHDLRLAVELGKTFGIPTGVVLNRDGAGDTDIAAYCEEERIPLLATIPFSRDIAAAYAEGKDLLASTDVWRKAIEHLYSELTTIEDQTARIDS